MTKPSLRALSTVVVMTTALAWGVTAHAASPEAKPAAAKAGKGKARDNVNVTGAGVTAGANDRIDGDTRSRALARAGAAPEGASAPATSSTPAAEQPGDLMDSMRNTARKAGAAAGRTWDRAKKAVQNPAPPTRPPAPQ